MIIKTFEQSLKGSITSKEIKLTTFVVPKPIPRNSKREYQSRNRETYAKWLYKVFYDNEVFAYQKKAKTNDQIQTRLLEENKHNSLLRKRFKQYKYTIGTFRRRYNQGVLYSAQPATFILSLQYDEHNYVVVGGNSPRTYMTFEDCYDRCMEFKVADPRFVPYEYIVAVRNKQIQNQEEWLKWVVPTDDDIKKFCTECKIKEIYNSVNFLSGWKREDTPTDYD
jgi:hypothetical protein